MDNTNQASHYENMYQLVYPTDGIMKDRMTRMKLLESEFHDTVADLTNDTPILDDVRLRDIAAYCSRDMYQLAIEDSRDGHKVSSSFSELQDLLKYVIGHHSIKKIQSDINQSDELGALSEIAVMTTILGAIDDGYISDGFAILAINKGFKKGLRDDVDIRAHLGPIGNSKNEKIQVKTSQQHERWIYKKGIKVVTSMGLARAISHKAKNIEPLVSALVSRTSTCRVPAYRALAGYLELELIEPDNELVS